VKIDLIKVVEAIPLDGFRVRFRFTNGEAGVRDFSEMLVAGGVMVEPLRDPVMFARVFVQNGVPAWPKGFDIDALALYREMADAGLLTAHEAA
jgi:hypothetical protein